MNVSVILPCYNAAPYVAQAIGSVLEQRRPPSEIIVVDDGSTDRSAAIARGFGDRVRVVSKRCGGASKARNHGARLAAGDALLFLDADDVLGPTALESMVEALTSNPAGVVLCPWYRLEKADGTWVCRPASCRPYRNDRDPLSNWLTGWWHPPCSVLWSRAAFERTYGWDQRAYVNDDGDLMMRALVAGIPLASTPHGAAYYRRLPADRASVSDARFTEAGIEARIYVVEKIAARLAEQNRIAPYREPLRTRFEEIGRDCGDTHPHLHARCKRLARRYGNPMWMRAFRSPSERARSASHRLRVELGRFKRSLTASHAEPSTRAHEPPETIRFGLDAASAIDPSEHARTAAAGAPAEDDLDRPTVSVVIPTYNRAHLIGRAIESVLAQTFDDFELLVIDDGSTDGTAEVVGSYADPRIRYRVQPANRGVSAARNRGLREARGEYIAFLDSDDAWFPAKLERQVARFRQFPEDVGLLYCGVETVEDNGESWIFEPEHRGDVYRHVLFENVIHTGSGVMIRRNVIRTVGFFDEDLPAIEDWDYWVRIARFYRFDFVDEPLVRYCNQESAVRKSLDQQQNLTARALFFKKHATTMHRAGVDHLFLIESARRHLKEADDVMGARRHMLRAVVRQPFKRETYHPPFSRLDLVAPQALAPRAHEVIRRGRTVTRKLLGQAS